MLVKSRSKNLVNVDLQEFQSLDSILTQISQQNKGINKNRLRLTYVNQSKHIPVVSNDFFVKKEFDSDITFYVKDLGPQISWRLVFMIEYFGPILIHSLMYYLSTDLDIMKSINLNVELNNPDLNKLVYVLIMIHYVKREFETVFIHSFSQSTMPLFILFKNSFHYWILNGLISLGYFGWGFPLDNNQIFQFYSKFKLNNLSMLLTLFGLSELWNFYSHFQLRRWGDLQKKKAVVGRVPINDGIFKIFVAPNYTFEVWSWIWFTLIFNLNLFSVLFLVVSTTQMYLWAVKKNKKYGTRRSFLIPFLF